MQLFYNSEININDDDLIMSDSEHHHLTKVLRKKTGDKVYLTNGNGYLFEAILNYIGEKIIPNIVDKFKKVLSNK